MKVFIKLKVNKLAKIKSTPRVMHLGKHLVTQDGCDYDIDEKLLESIQCKEWMDVSEPKDEAPAAPAPVANEEDVNPEDVNLDDEEAGD